jgi:hypothetical protein
VHGMRPSLAFGDDERAAGGQEEIEAFLVKVGIHARLHRPKRLRRRAETVHRARSVLDEIIAQPYGIEEEPVAGMEENGNIRIGHGFHGRILAHEPGFVQLPSVNGWYASLGRFRRQLRVGG